MLKAGVKRTLFVAGGAWHLAYRSRTTYNFNFQPLRPSNSEPRPHISAVPDLTQTIIKEQPRLPYALLDRRQPVYGAPGWLGSCHLAGLHSAVRVPGRKYRESLHDSPDPEEFHGILRPPGFEPPLAPDRKLLNAFKWKGRASYRVNI